MRKALFAVLFLAFSAPLTLSQEYKRGEFGVGYSANFVDSEGAFSTSATDDGRDTFHGFYVNGGGNFSRYLGIQGEVAHYRKSTDFTSVAGLQSRLEGRITEGLIGIKVQDNAMETKVRPFARALIGAGHVSGDFTIGTTSTSDNDTGLAAVLGGGIAFRVSRHADIVGSADYNPIRLDNNTGIGSSKEFEHNFRVGVGLNFRF